MDLKELSSVVQTGSQKKSKELVKKALDEKIEPVKILNDGM
ncbi:MAG TPA: cobalamin-binding protein, partial [Clostridium sp.]|nr:cobalamin-binding protein [Clostridium sp.]